VTHQEAALFGDLGFRFPFRKYQRLILAHLEAKLRQPAGDRRLHIVAPPGSGKTIIGLELIRRLGSPAVVFAPTTTIQGQWRDEVGMFVEDPARVADLTSSDPSRLAPISVFTYQLISTSAAADEQIKDMARRAWVEELLVAGQADGEEQARARLEEIRENNPSAYSRDLARRSGRVKRAALRSDDPNVSRFLHANARRLVDDLMAHGVRTVLLDECHHLLDYWAIVIGHLVGRIDDPTVIGLTATLPSPEDGFEYENYTGLLGEVDYEVPTPAVVKEGDLAPYRDLVGFVEPTPRERTYLQNIQGAFTRATASVADDPRFRDWVGEARFQTGAGPEERWEQGLKENAPVAVAGLRFLRSVGLVLPAGVPIPAEAADELGLEDWLALFERYGFDALKTSADREDHQRLAELRRALRPFGFTLTERGLRQSRSPGDLVLAYSESKVEAAAQILMREEEALGDRLRAVVVTDFERTGASRRVEALHPEAGSARHTFLSLVAHEEAGRLDPVLVTGRTMWIDADHGEELVARFNEDLARLGARAECRIGSAAPPGALEVVGEGRDWSPGTYVRMVTEAFERGEVKCLVGTRGLFAEGWDALTLNTLVDLTSATTASSVQQLRGRSIRKDPAWPGKVAHNWDVVCVSKEFERGDGDFRRFSRRHGRTWGVIPSSRAVDSEHHGRVVKGLFHVDPQLASEVLSGPFKRADFQASTHRMLKEIPKRTESYALWKVGEEYSNFSYATTRLDARDLKIRTVYTVQQTLRRMLAAFRWGLLSAAGLGVWYGLQAMDAVEQGGGSLVGAVGIGVAVVTAIVVAFNARSAWRIARRIREQPPDAILLDVGRALLAGLQVAGLVSRNLQPDYVRVVEQPDLSYEVLLDYASPDDAKTFIDAYREIFAPVVDQRYLIRRSDRRLPDLWLAPFWAVLRVVLRPRGSYPPAYHPVPAVLATRRELADAFAENWRRYVGQGDLVYTRREDGWRVLLQARAERRPRVKSLAFEIWK
jgi:superfamily II DNA or RNA helicase